MNESKHRVFNYGSYSYTYELIMQDRKTLALVINPDMSIVVKCPANAEEDKIEMFLSRKWFWLNKQINFFQKVKRNTYKREYTHGSRIYYLGRSYKLSINRGKTDRVQLLRGVFQVETTHPVKDADRNKKLIDGWLKKRCAPVIGERLIEMHKKFSKHEIPKFEIKSIPKRWGSFINSNKIIINSKLIHASKDCIDYVIVHELCHLENRSHDKYFWRLLERKYPGWQKIKNKLEILYGNY